MARHGTSGNDHLESKNGWWIFGSYEKTLYGYGGDDLLEGGKQDDNLYGDEGNDDLLGNKGDDYLEGGTGDDLLNGGSGDDDLYGGYGYDILTGGNGADLFIFKSPWEGIDTITDFYYEEGDAIQVSASGFGIGSSDYSRFWYDSSSGALFFDQTQIALLNIDSGFSPSADINIVT